MGWGNVKGHCVGVALNSVNVRRRPTLPRPPGRSTIGAEELNFQVRNGTGCFPFAMVTETLLRCVGPDHVVVVGVLTVSREPHSGRVAHKSSLCSGDKPSAY